MRFRSPAGGVALLTTLLVLPSIAQGATLGNDLSGPANGGFGCETRFLPGMQPDQPEQPVSAPGSTCSLWSFQSSFTPNAGTVTKLRVKSGPNPAPLQVAIFRRLFTTNPENPVEVTDAQCCTGIATGPVFQPKPNAVTEVAVNLPTTAKAPAGRLSGWNDFVAVSGVGNGDLPITSTGPHTFNAQAAGAPFISVNYPKFEGPFNSNQNEWNYVNYKALVQFDWVPAGATGCPGAAGAKAGASQCNKPKTPVSPAVKAPFSFRSKNLKLKNGKVKVPVKCTAPKGQRCKGKVGLRTRAKKPKALASKKVNLKGGKKATVTLKLSRKARKRVRKKKNKVTLTVNLGAQGKGTRNVTLKR